VPPEVPVGLPAALLERRPDVLAAEQQLVASNANVGAAKALFFPTISLTGLLGTISGDFDKLLKADSNVWQASPGLFAPIFQGGRIRRNHDAAKARFEQALAQYQKAALNSYREVANAIVSVKKLGEARLELEDGVEALQNAARLSRSRYDAGLASYLEILNADQQLFDQEIQLAQVRGEEMRAFVELYRALGGGWQAEPGTTAATP
jgi:multidrug efflux system outer membrane protein